MAHSVINNAPAADSDSVCHSAGHSSALRHTSNPPSHSQRARVMKGTPSANAVSAIGSSSASAANGADRRRGVWLRALPEPTRA